MERKPKGHMFCFFAIFRGMYVLYTPPRPSGIPPLRRVGSAVRVKVSDMDLFKGIHFSIFLVFQRM